MEAVEEEGYASVSYAPISLDDHIGTTILNACTVQRKVVGAHIRSIYAYIEDLMENNKEVILREIVQYETGTELVFGL